MNLQNLPSHLAFSYLKEHPVSQYALSAHTTFQVDARSRKQALITGNQFAVHGMDTVIAETGPFDSAVIHSEGYRPFTAGDVREVHPSGQIDAFPGSGLKSISTFVFAARTTVIINARSRKQALKTANDYAEHGIDVIVAETGPDESGLIHSEHRAPFTAADLSRA